MTSRTVTIASSAGLHARPAALFVQAATGSGQKVLIAKGDGAAVDATSILQVMTMGAGHGDAVTLTVEGPDAERVLEELTTLLGTDLDAVGA